MVLVGALTLILLIPQIMVESLITDRQQRRDSVTSEVTDKWGKAQTISGPFLVLPYARSERNHEGKLIEINDRLFLLPRQLTVASQMVPEIRYRSIFEVVLYSTHTVLTGEFSLEYLERLQIPSENIRWKDAEFILGITDLKGIRDTPDARWNGEKMDINAGMADHDVAPAGLSSRVEISPRKKTYRFDITMSLNGSAEMNIIPVGEQTKAIVTGTWANPSFLAAYLPVKRTIENNSFQAEWQILHLNREYPQAFVSGRYKIGQSAFGVKLILPIDEYQKTMRTTKYAVMFIALTFMAFFVSEILRSRAIHPVQYALIGFALLLFYVLLLSLSEHIAFELAYLIASVAVVALISTYTRAIFGALRPSLALGGVLVVLYGFLYVIVQAQDYALLFGSLGLFASLALIMFLTRNIDWFAMGKNKD
jgi:inner membrane protein